MTEERKQELRQLLEEAMENLEIRHEYGPVSLPVDIYRSYLQERWTYYGLDILSLASANRFTLNIVNEATKSKLLDFIKGALAQFIDGEYIPIGSYLIESDSTGRSSRLHYLRYQRDYLYLLLERFLKITIVRGIEEAVTIFDESCCPEGASSLFQDVVLLGGIKIETEVEVIEGVRLVPLPSSERLYELMRYLPSFLLNSFMHPIDDFFEKTLLVIDRPGFSIFHEPAANPLFPMEFSLDNLPFQVEVHDVQFPNSEAVRSFKDFFCQALSLVINSAVKITHGGWFLAPDKSLALDDGLIGVYRSLNSFEISSATEEANIEDIEEAKCLYNILANLDLDTLEKLQISINRWIRSKMSENEADQMIDLGIALEALYVPDGGGDLTYKFSIRAARHLGTDRKDREELLKKFGQIYGCRSDAVHGGKLKKRLKFGEDRIPISKFIEKTQNLCRESIIAILKDGNIPDWNSLILGGEEEQASS